MFHDCLSICTLVYYVFTMFIFSTTPYNTQRFGRSLETRLQAADVKFLRACSFLFMRFRPGAECLGSQVGNIISPCPNSQKVARKNCSNSYGRVNSVINSSIFMDFCSLDSCTHVGNLHPEHRNVEKQGLQRPLSDPQCFGGALSFASWSLSKGACWWMFGMWMHRWENGEMI